MAGYDLTPTMRDINKKFSVRYFLNLVLMDTEDRRYFKQQEITLWRKGDIQRKQNIQSPMMMQGQMSNSEQINDSQEEVKEQQQPTVKEDFIKAPKSQSNDSLNADPFDQNSDITENQIHNMTREAGDGQNDTSTDNAE